MNVAEKTVDEELHAELRTAAALQAPVPIDLNQIAQAVVLQRCVMDTLMNTSFYFL